MHTLTIISPGGLVSEALKIAEFVSTYHIEVNTDWSCESKTPDQKFCGCASSCALIWLAAPMRKGLIVKVHRPYFTGTEFHTLPDTVALQKYNEASFGVRAVLQARGYSPEFIATIFRVPREQAKQLSLAEIAGLPIDVALDELLSARCYRGNEQALSKHEATLAEIARVNKEREKLSNELPNLTGYQLERDPIHSLDYAKLTAMYRRIEALEKQAQASKGAYDDFRGCKFDERRQASLRKSGQRLTADVRAKVKGLASLVREINTNDEVDRMLEKTNTELGKQAAEDIKEREARLQRLWPELKSTLPTGHVEFISDGLK